MYFRISIVLYTLVERIELDIKKSSGLIMHPTALPSKYGIGDFGNTSKEFIDFLKETSTNVWQVLPLGLTSLDEFSPYSSPSSILGNRYLIDIEQLDGFDNKNYNVENFSKEYVEYKKVYDFKDLVFKDLSQTINPDDEIYSNFLKEELIKQHITFLVLKDLNQTVWTSWDNEYKEYSEKLFEKLLKDESNLMNFHIFTQYEFFKQWNDLKKYANDKKINILGDIPIYVNHDSADVWLNKEIFELDQSGEMEFISVQFLIVLTNKDRYGVMLYINGITINLTTLNTGKKS